MNNIATSSLVFANVVEPVNSSVKPAVGFEDTENKNQVIPPVEQSSANDKSSNSDAEKPSQDIAQNAADAKRDQEIQQIIKSLAAREREVIAHEQAHAAVGGKYAGSPSYSYERGPDGVNYVVSGEVPISLPSGGDDPAVTIAAARQVRRAALAPANPSPQDRSVAAEAGRIERQAIADLAALRAEQQKTEQNESTEAEQETKGAEDGGLEQEQSSRRSDYVNQQFITSDTVQPEQSIGSVLDRLA